MTGNRIAVFLVLVAALVLGYFGYQHFHQAKVDESGEVACKGCMTADEKAKFEKENSGDTPDGQSEHKLRTAAAEDKAGFPDANAPVNGTPGTAAGATASATEKTNLTPVTQTNQPAAQNVSGAAPMTDSQSPNAPNGMRFGGSGNYQWYRQGNITWRVDTASGRSCIVYATMEEWQKQIVMEHGCGRSA
jgi:hypothetical protein